MGTSDPFMRFLALPGGQEPEAVFGFALPSLPDISASPWLLNSSPQERLQEALRLQVRLIQACWGSGITALDLRFLRMRNEPDITIALLCRLRCPSSIPSIHSTFAATAWHWHSIYSSFS